MAERVTVKVRCSVCGTVASTQELIPPDGTPPDSWLYRRSGIETSNGGSGDRITPEEAALIDEALGVPYRTEALVAAGLHPDDGFCFKCERAYCRKHWNVSSTGYGTCPEGHGTTLDPHWSPDW